MTQPESSVSFPALGTTAVVAVSDPARLGDARAAVEEVVAEFDLACSRFREDSELSALNAAGGVSVRVSPLLLDAVAAALRAARLTDGDVDPTVGQALIALGYDRDFAALRSGGSRARGATSVSIASVAGWRTVALDREASTVRLARGVMLDLGATAKALAADRAAERAHSVSGRGVLVSLGGDLALAGSPPPDGWRVRVTDDHRSGTSAPGQWIALSCGGLATSSTTVRRWQTGSGSAHHLLDPATGQPATVIWRTVSVAAASCLDANIASTAAIVRGERAVPWLGLLGLPSRLVRADGSVLHLAGWPSSGDEESTARKRREVVAAG
jgi:FAD:protein FMN transferase